MFELKAGSVNPTTLPLFEIPNKALVVAKLRFCPIWFHKLLPNL